MSNKNSTTPATDSPSTESGQGQGDRHPAHEAARKKTVRVDGRFILVVLIVFAVLCGATFALHSFQVERSTESLLTLADEAEANDDAKAAKQYLAQYLRFKPDDHDTKVRLTKLIAKTDRTYAGRLRVKGMLEDVLRNDPDRDDADQLRRRVVDNVLALRRFGGDPGYRAALTHLKILREKNPADAELTYLAGRCQLGLSDYDKTIRTLLKAIHQAETPADEKPESTVKYYTLLAGVLELHPNILPRQEELQSEMPDDLSEGLKSLFPRKNSTAAANGNAPSRQPIDEKKVVGQVISRIYSRLVERGRPRHAALIARGDYHRMQAKTVATQYIQKELEAAQKDIDAALAINPKRAATLLSAALLALARSVDATTRLNSKQSDIEFQKAASFVRTGTQLDAPENLDFFKILYGITLLESSQSKELKEAAQVLHQARKALDAYRETKHAKEVAEPFVLNRRDFDLQVLEANLLHKQIIKPNGLPDETKLAEYQAMVRQLNQFAQQNGFMRSERSILILEEAKALLVQHKWRDAIVRLNTARMLRAVNQNDRRKIDRYLASCYDRLGNPTRSIRVYRTSLETDSRWHDGRRVLAERLRQAGLIDEALKQIRLIINDYRLNTSNGESSDGRIPIYDLLSELRLQLSKTDLLPAAERNLAPIFQALKKMEAGIGKEVSEDLAVALVTLAADAMLVESAAAGHANFQKIDKLLADAIATYPTRISLRLRRASNAAIRPDREKEERVPAALKIVDGALAVLKKEKLGKIQQAGQLVVILRARSIIVTMLPAKDALAELKLLESQANQQLDGEFRLIALEAVARGLVTINLFKESRDIWRSVIKTRSSNVGGKLIAYDLNACIASAVLSIQINDIDGLEDVDLPKIEAIEGPDGALGNYYKARGKLALISKIHEEARAKRKQLSAEQKSKKQEHLKEARKLLLHATEIRPRAAHMVRLHAGVEMLLKNPDEGYRLYRRAISLGDRSSVAFTVCVEYLLNNQSNQDDRLREADDLIRLAANFSKRLLPDDSLDLASNRPSLKELAIQVAFGRGEFDRIPDLLQGEKEGRSMNLILAQKELSIYRRMRNQERKSPSGIALLKRANKYFDDIVEKTPREWNIWVTRHARLGNTDEVKRLARKAWESLPEDIRDSTVAPYYRLIGDTEKAEKHFIDAIRNQPTNVNRHLMITGFYVGQAATKKAKKHLDFVLDAKSKATPGQLTRARHWRRLSKIVGGSQNDFRDALKALPQPAKANLEELYARADLLRRSTLRVNRASLINVLEEIQQRKAALTPSEQFMLARLHEGLGRWDTAKPLVEKLLTADPRNATLLAWHAVAILRNETAKANAKRKISRGLWDRLKVVEPNSLRTAAVLARIEDAEKQPALAKTALTKWADGYVSGRKQFDQTEARPLLLAARLAEELNFIDTAEDLFRRYGTFSERPENRLAVSTFLGRQGQYNKALKVCSDAQQLVKPVAIAVTAANVVAYGNPSPADVSLAENLAKTALATDPKSVRMRSVYATLLTTVGRFDEAEAQFREILNDNPRSLSVANNLAWMLGMRNVKLTEAKQLIDNVIKRIGPSPVVLDTRAVILLNLQQPRQALADLKQAVIERDDAIPYLHLAQAYLALDDKPAAVKALRRAIEEGLNVKELHKLEQPGYWKAIEATGLAPRG